MAEQKASSEGSSRWWEFYAVRYAMGTVVGAIVFYFLCRETPFLRPLLFDISSIAPTATAVSPPSAVKLDSVQLSLLAAYGLVYCYIASAPILVFHAGRFLLGLHDVGRVWPKLLVILSPPVVALVAIWCLASGLGLGEHWFYLIAGFFIALFLWLQYLVVGLTLVKNKELFAFYQSLSKNREHAKGGITDSYRHLREHGNSFFIVLLEILLGIVLVGVSVVGQTSAPTTPVVDNRLLVNTVILVLWIIPSVLVWLVGTLFEREFSRVNAEQGAPADAPKSGAPLS